MKKILIGVIAVIALCLSGCSDVGRYQLCNNGALMIDTKTGDVYIHLTYKRLPYYRKLKSEKEIDEIIEKEKKEDGDILTEF